MIVERALRTIAILIAILGLVDPVLTLSGRHRPVVGVAVVPSRSGDAGLDAQADGASRATGAATGGGGAHELRTLQAQVVEALERDFDVRTGLTSGVAGLVLIGDGDYPSALSLPSSMPVSAVVGAPARERARIVRVDAPARVHISGRIPVTVQLEGQGLAGRTSTIVLRSNGLELARTTHTWHDAAERANVTLHALPLQVGPARVTAEIVDSTGSASSAGSGAGAAGAPGSIASSAADVAVDVHDTPFQVLVLNARPSWATQFIRRALEEDPRFVVSSATQITRRLGGSITASTGRASALNIADLEIFHAIVVGAPEALDNSTVDRLRMFTRERGGLVIVAPDRRPEGHALELLPARRFDEQLRPEPVALVDATSAIAAKSAQAGVTPLWASELAVPQDMLPGASVLLRLSPGTTAAPPTTASTATTAASTEAPPIVIGSALGNGFVILSGALDAWRYRDRDRERPRDGGFDRFWRETIAARAAAVPDPLEVTLTPAIVSPGGRVSVQVRTRPARTDLPARQVAVANTNEASSTITVRATLTPQPASTPIPVRLWPDARPSAYHGALNAPSQDGVYAVSVQLDGRQTKGEAVLRVERGARGARSDWRGLQAFVEARRGVLVTSDQPDRLIQHLREAVRPSGTQLARHPFRSAWWIIPFAACLGVEWLLRRRRGER